MTHRGRPSLPPAGHVHGWIDWYRFARDTLGLGHNEALPYNVRHVEEENQAALKLRSTAPPFRTGRDDD